MSHQDISHVHRKQREASRSSIPHVMLPQHASNLTVVTLSNAIVQTIIILIIHDINLVSLLFLILVLIYT